MAEEFRNSAAALAERALKPNVPLPSGNSSLITIEQGSTHLPERPEIYRGTMPLPEQGTPTQNVPLPPRGKKASRKKVSTFNIILILIGTAAAIVLYISNIIAVDQLMSDINKLQQHQQKILMEQEILKARVNQMSSLERIQRRAEEELGLQTPKQAPIWLKVDPEKIEEIQRKTDGH